MKTVLAIFILSVVLFSANCLPAVESNNAEKLETPLTVAPSKIFFYRVDKNFPTLF